MRKLLLIVCLVAMAWLSISSCKSKPGPAKEEQAIRELLKQEREAHFDRNADLFVSEFSDSMISVNKGLVTKNSIAENKKRIGTYFGKVKFIKWDDIAEPVVKVSDDGTLAYAIVQKQVVLSYPDSLGKTIVDTTDYAWISIYRKSGNEWKVEANASTNK